MGDEAFIDPIPGTLGTAPEQVPHQSAASGFPRTHGAVEQRPIDTGRLATKPGGRSARFMARHAAPLDDGMHVLPEVDQSRAGRRTGRLGAVTQCVDEAVGRGALRVFVASYAPSGLAPAGPDPPAASERQSVLVEKLKLQRGVRRHLDVKRAVGGKVELTPAQR